MQNGSPNSGEPRGRRSHAGEGVGGKPYPYLTTGLDNIFLLNGYEVINHDGEEYVSITDMEGLHRAIGRHLVITKKGLSSKEVRFLRKTMGMSQSALAAKLGNDPQSVARWEKGTSEMPGPSEKLLRAVFWAKNIINETIDLPVLQRLLVSDLEELDLLDELNPVQASFKLGDGWDEAKPKQAA